ncbi:MAG: MBL fold metallo-hydrolase [Chloroflexi bacterium]|nr:MBL fold metallo-hydrolase [Chloroflexota bacterium]
MISITCCDGVGVIGGNKILLEDEEKDTRIFLDFGLDFSQAGKYYEDFLQKRTSRGCLDYLIMGVLPPVQGLYRDDIEPPGLWEHPFLKNHPHLRRANKIDGIILSHAHLDHWGLIGYLKKEIPLYTGSVSALLIKATQDAGSSDHATEAILLNPKTWEKGSAQSDSRADYITRELKITGERLTGEAVEFLHESRRVTKKIPPIKISPGDIVGNIRLESYPVDHSILGASAYALETSSGWVVYTGDFRLHGENGHLVKNFIKAAAGLKPRVLICEGTRAGSKKGTSEAEVEAYSLEAVRMCPHLVFADFGLRNMERLFSFERIAQYSGRRLVISEKAAYLLYALSRQDAAAKTLLSSSNVYIYKESSTSASTWKKELPEKVNLRFVEAKQIRENQEKALLCMGFYDLNELPDIIPRPGSLYIYSSTEAFTDEQVLDRRRLMNWLDYFKMDVIPKMDPLTGKFTDEAEKHYHSSGHISGEELLEAVREINPEILIPVHTEDPGWFERELKNDKIRVVLPVRGEPIKI